MSKPIHETLRAIGQGILVGTVTAIPLCLAVAYLSPAALLGAAVATGATLITVANSLKRRDQRKARSLL